MKKLFTVSDGRSVFVEEEGRVYEIVDWDKEEWSFCNAAGQPLPDYDKIDLEDLGTILAKKDGCITVFDYYQD